MSSAKALLVVYDEETFERWLLLNGLALYDVADAVKIAEKIAKTLPASRSVQVYLPHGPELINPEKTDAL